MKKINGIKAPYPQAQMTLRKYQIVDNHGFFPPVLLDYFNKGSLDLYNSSSSSEVRLEAGRKLARYHHVGFGSGAKATDLSKIRVDGSGSVYSQDIALDAQSKYTHAMAVVPPEWRDVVELVCIHDLRIKAPKDLSQADGQDYVTVRKQDLARALNRIARYFRFGNRE